jgi:hypothetical protein
LIAALLLVLRGRHAPREQRGDAPVSEEDVPIRHSRDEDALWFYGTVFAAPVLVLVFGLWYVRRKRSRGSR